MRNCTTYIALIFLLLVCSCQQGFYHKKQPKATANAAVHTVAQFRQTSPLHLDQKRRSLLETFETYSDSFPDSLFKAYMAMPEAQAEEQEDTVPILYAYREAFDKVLYEVKNTKVKYGSTAVWLLYNMGFVVKTPSGCFGIDLDHRLAEQFEPYLDFLIITHNHGDHQNEKLIAAMAEKGKPILSNFHKDSGVYLSTTATQYTIGNFKIRTDISDHLRHRNFQNFVTLFRIDCGEDSGGFSMLHGGDTGFDPKRFTNVQGPVSLLVMRWGEARENDILGTGPGQVQPDYAVLSHLIELRHKPYPKGQASIKKTLEHLPNVKCEHTLLPFWGEMLTWENDTMR